MHREGARARATAATSQERESKKNAIFDAKQLQITRKRVVRHREGGQVTCYGGDVARLLDVCRARIVFDEVRPLSSPLLSSALSPLHSSRATSAFLVLTPRLGAFEPFAPPPPPIERTSSPALTDGGP